MSTSRANKRFAFAFAGVCLAAHAAAAHAYPTALTGEVDPVRAVTRLETRVVGLPLYGTVADSNGTLLANAQVFIPALNRTTTTDGNGRFSFGPVPTGKYQITAIAIGYAPIRRAVEVPREGDSVDVKLVMKKSALTIEAVHVTAATTSSDARRVTQSTVQLSGQALSRNLGNSVATTLESQPGMAVRYNGPTATTPVIRGLTGDRVLVLQNGERSGDLSSAAPDHALSIDPLAAQRIEVVRGPASLLYGSNALGGVVNIINTDIPNTVPNHIEGSFATQAGTGNPGAATSTGVTVPLTQSLAFAATGNWRGVNDSRQGGGAKLLNSFDHQGGGSAGVGYVGERVTGGLAYEGFRFNYGLPGDPIDPELGAHIRGQRQEVSGRSDISFNRLGLSSLRLDGSAQWYKHDEIENTGEIGTEFNLKTQTLNATARSAFGPLTGAIGASGLFKEYASTGEEALTPAANTRSGGLFAFQDIPLSSKGGDDVPHLQLGARYDLYNVKSKIGDPKFGPAVSRNFNSASGSVGLVVPVSQTVSLTGSVSRAFRAPTVEELFSNAFHAAVGTFDIGNPNLKAETNNGAEIVLRAHSAKVNGQLSTYYNRINNYVLVNIVGDTTVDGSTVPLNRYSQADATLKGGEGMLEAEVIPHIVVGTMGDIVRGALTSGEPLPFMPAARLGGNVRYDDGTFNLGAEYRHGFAQNRVPPAVSEADQSAIKTDAYNLVNLAAGYNLNQRGFLHSIVLRVDNVFDTKYKDATSRIKGFAFNPGRNVSVVYKVLF